MDATIRNDAFYIDAGFNAFRLGLTSFDAPYKPGSKKLKLWLAGYSMAKSNHAKAMVVNEKNKPTPSTTVAPSGRPMHAKENYKPRARRGTADRQNRFQ